MEGITTILASDKEGMKAVLPSLLRTLSADMSSRKWMAENGLKITNIEANLSEEEDELEEEGKSQSDIWNSIQEEKKKKKKEEIEMPWRSILVQDRPVVQDPPPYVHPLVKRSASSLSKQSLEVCTESLGSETGSDGFSSYTSSETGDDDVREEDSAAEQKVVVSSVLRRRDSLCRTRSFPPPLPSISRQNGKCFYVRPRRDEGRLVLEAVSVAAPPTLKANRKDGRLVLTFVDDSPTGELLEDENEKYSEGLMSSGEDNDNGEPEPEDSEEEEEEEEEEKSEEETEEAEERASGTKLSLLINKPVVLSNRNPVWPNKFTKVVLFEQEEKGVVHCPKQLPGLGRVAPVSPYNAYEYFWRAKPTTIISPARNQPTLIIKNYNNNKYIVSKEPASDREEVVVVRGNRAKYLVPLMRSCKETRRSLLFWESHCIATS